MPDYKCLQTAGLITLGADSKSEVSSAGVTSTIGPNGKVFTNEQGLSSAVVPTGNNVAGVAGEDPGKKTVTVATIGSDTDPVPGQKPRDLLDTYLANQHKLGCTP